MNIPLHIFPYEANYMNANLKALFPARSSIINKNVGKGLYSLESGTF